MKKTIAKAPPVSPHFSAVRKAREAIKEKALEHYHLLIGIIKQSVAGGDYETAAKYTAWLIEHTPADEGDRVLDISIDKPSPSEGGPKGTVVNIGFKIGADEKKKLPEGIVIDVLPE